MFGHDFSSEQFINNELNDYRTRKLTHCLILMMIIFCSACQEASVSCLSDLQCDEESVCVAGQCLGAELEDRDPELYYAEEMHYRLVAECGICHAATAVSEPVPPIDQINMEEYTPDDPYELPRYTTELGDSGWRIYIDNLTPERLRASYLETMQYIDLNAPENSLLFAFGRGEVGINEYQPHPKLYTTKEELEIGQKAPIAYERLLNWARLPHLDPELITYNLQNYLDGPQMVIKTSCGGCHDQGGPIFGDALYLRGGFAFKAIPENLSDLADLTALINLEEPEKSSLIRLYIGEYDHILIAQTEESLEPLKEVIIPWIESLR